MTNPSTAALTANSAASYPSLHNQVVFISGGATGIGEAFVRAFAGQHARVAFVDIDQLAGEKLTTELTQAGHTVRFDVCDVTDIAKLQSRLAGVAAQWGPVRTLVNNAANDVRHDPASVTPDFFDQTIAVNLRHQFFASQAVAPGMATAGGGSIINLGSISWMNKGAGFPIYATCKAAIQGLTRSLARDLGKQNIRVNALVPGWVMTDKQLKMWVKPESEREIDAAQCLPGRLMPDDIAAMALFLAADDSRMCTAQNFIVDAGWT